MYISLLTDSARLELTRLKRLTSIHLTGSAWFNIIHEFIKLDRENISVVKFFSALQSQLVVHERENSGQRDEWDSAIYTCSWLDMRQRLTMQACLMHLLEHEYRTSTKVVITRRLR